MRVGCFGCCVDGGCCFLFFYVGLSMVNDY